MKGSFGLHFKINFIIFTTRNGSIIDMTFEDGRRKKLHSIFELLQTDVIYYRV